MSFTRIFHIITLFVCLSVTNIGAEAYSWVDENGFKRFSDPLPIQAAKVDARRKIVSKGPVINEEQAEVSYTESIARIELPKERPVETKFVMGKHLRVPVKIVYNGRVFTTLFELDTGSSHTIISQVFATKLGARTQPAGRGSISDVKVIATAFKVASIKVGPIERKDHQILILHSNQERWSQLRGMNILGMDLLKEVPFTIDYKAGLIKWGNNSARSTKYQIKTRAIIKNVRVFLPVKIVYKGQTFTKLFVLDTGAPQTSVTPIFAKMLGITDVRPGRRVKISRIKAGPLELRDRFITIWNAPDNLIGMDLLKDVTFTIDYDAGVIKWNL